jgi:hypothetical protein
LTSSTGSQPTALLTYPYSPKPATLSSPGDGRARIDEAVAVIRKHRAVSLGMPGTRPPAPGSRALP